MHTSAGGSHVSAINHGGHRRIRDAAVKAQENARRVLYDSAGRECELLKAVIASECRLESVNVNMNRTYGNQQPEGFNANGSFAYRVMLK